MNKRVIISMLVVVATLIMSLSTSEIKTVQAFSTTNATNNVIVGIKPSTSNIQLKSNGYVKSIRIYSYDAQGYISELNSEVNYYSMNESVATVFEGDIRATGKGQTDIIAEYKGFSTSIKVIVKNDINLDSLEETCLEKAGTSKKINYSEILTNNYSLSSVRTSQQILDKAAAMKNVSWTPTKDLVGWNNKIIFRANVKQTGIPYSQFNQVDDIGFTNALSKTDFYTNYTDPDTNNSMPRYGVDCSRYVCYSLNITLRYTGALVSDIKNPSTTTDIIKVGSYDPKALVKSQLYSAYALLASGNAAVYFNGTSGHAILVLSNSPSSKEIVVYETCNTVPIVSIYTYDSLWEKGYLPFKLK